jgi:hypothetical protein
LHVLYLSISSSSYNIQYNIYISEKCAIPHRRISCVRG